MVYMPALMTAIDRSRMELVAVHDDRHNYYLWARNGQRRWEANREEIVRKAGEETYRLFNLLFGGTAGVMSNPSHDTGAYRMVLELPG
jgi:cyclopropane-fatty-acyl-phospholipid synthase